MINYLTINSNFYKRPIINLKPDTNVFFKINYLTNNIEANRYFSRKMAINFNK